MPGHASVNRIMRTSLPILVQMPNVVTFTTDKVPAAGWYGHTKGLHTVAIRVLNFQGRVSLQGSLASAPGAADWFALPPGGAAYLQYPRGPILDANLQGETSVVGLTFICNCLWLRAVVDRSYLLLSTTDELTIARFGSVDSILVNY